MPFPKWEDIQITDTFFFFLASTRENDCQTNIILPPDALTDFYKFPSKHVIVSPTNDISHLPINTDRNFDHELVL